MKKERAYDGYKYKGTWRFLTFHLEGMSKIEFPTKSPP